MALPRAITNLMKETVTVKTVTNVDGYGNKVLSAGTAVKAYLSYQNRRIWSQTGEFLVSGLQAYLATDVPDLTPEGQVVLPDGSTPPIRSVSRPAWPDGTRHTEVVF